VVDGQATGDSRTGLNIRHMIFPGEAGSAMFVARLINDPFSDPGLYVKFKYKSEALLFDLGDLHALMPREILRVSHIFVSHTHMDHFIGFDHVMRICLGRNRHINLFGPPGFIANVEHKLGAYTWNLVENYTNDFTLHVTELLLGERKSARYECRRKFHVEANSETEPWHEDEPVVDTGRFVVQTAFLDHKIPSLAFSLKETSRVNIMRNLLDERGLPTGNWLLALKEAVLDERPDSTMIAVKGKARAGFVVDTERPLGELRDLVRVTRGQKIAYIPDAVYHEKNSEKIIALAWESDILFIEATFLHEDARTAAEKYHLTAQQAGLLARAARVKQMKLFHYSPKYKGKGLVLRREADSAFAGQIRST